MARFTEQTGLEVKTSLGLRAVLPTRGRNDGSWKFRNIFCCTVTDKSIKSPESTDGRKVYLANPMHKNKDECKVVELGRKKEHILPWVSPEYYVLSGEVDHIIKRFNWETEDTDWFRRIPCVGASPLTDSMNRELGCGLAVSSIILLYKPSVLEDSKIIMLRRKGDEYPGYAGGKIETLRTPDSRNLDPVTCCIEEGKEEFGFEIIPKGLVSCSATALDMPRDGHYNSIVNYCFVAEPVNQLEVRNALKNPRKFLEDKMECHVVEGFEDHEERIKEGGMRMPDMIGNGTEFLKGTPGSRIPLGQIIRSGTI